MTHPFMHKTRRRKTLLFIVATFILGGLAGYFIHGFLFAQIPKTTFQDEAFWQTAGKIILFLFLALVPIGYFFWLILGLSQISRPKQPLSTIGNGHIPKNIAQIKRILIPVGDGPNVLSGLRLLAQLGGDQTGKITLLRIVPPSSPTSIEEQTTIIKDLAHKSLLDVSHNFELEIKIIPSNNLVQTIITTAREGRYDLLVVGASERTQLGSFLFGTIPYRLAELSPCPVVIIRNPKIN